MYAPVRLFLGNLLTHKSTLIEYEQGVPVLIQGRNLFDVGQKANGTGKSAILEGLAIALTGSPMRDVSIKDMVRDGEEKSELQFDLYDALSDNMLSIHREIFAKKSKSATVRVYLNGKERDVTSVNHGNDIILELLDLNKEDLYNYFLISKFKYEPFLSASDGRKKKVISRFSQASLLDPVIDKMTGEIKEVESEKVQINTDIEVIKSKIEVYQGLIDKVDLKEEERNKKEFLDRLKNQKKEYLEEKKGYKKKAEELNQELILLEQQIEDGDKRVEEVKKSMDVVLAQLEKQYDDIQARKKRRGELEEQVQKLNLQLADKVDCPACNHEFSVKDPNLKVADVEDAIKDLEAKIVQYFHSTSKLENERVELKKKVEPLKEKKQLEESLVNKLREKEHLALMNQRLNEQNKKGCVADIEAIDLQIAAKEKEEIKDPTHLYKKEIDKLQPTLAELKQDLEECDSDIATFNQLKELYTQYKTFLTNQAIGSIEAKVNEYLEDVGTNLSIQLDGYTENASGKISERISATVLRNGIAEAVYGRFSGGERMRIDIAVIVALQRLINESSSAGLDLLFLDEIVESGDSLAIEGTLKALQKTEQTIQIVTHGTFDDIYPNVCMIEKTKNGYSVVAES